MVSWAVSPIQYFYVFLQGLSTFGTLAVRKELGSELGANWGSGQERSALTGSDGRSSWSLSQHVHLIAFQGFLTRDTS